MTQKTNYIRAVFILGALLPSLGASAQEIPFIRVLYAVDWQQVAGARVSLYSDTDSLLETGISDPAGRYMPGEALAFTSYLIFEHADYTSVRISRNTLESNNYRIFFEEKLFNVPEVVFTANKYRENREDIPFQIEVIRAGDISFRNPATAANLLEQDGSIFVQRSQMGGGSPNLRGFEANKVLLVIDGVRMNNAIYRGGHLQNVITLDPNMIERTEIMFGPASVIYGSDALGGVMHFYTRDPKVALQDTMIAAVNLMSRYASANQEKSFHADISLGFERIGSLTSFTLSDFEDLRSGSRRRTAFPDFGKREFYVERIGKRDSMVRNEDFNLQKFSGYTQYDFMQKLSFLQNDKISHKLNFQYSSSSNVPRYDRLSQISGDTLQFADWHYGPQKRMLLSYNFKLSKTSPFYDHLNLIFSYQHIEESRITRRFNQRELRTRAEDVRVLSANADAQKIVARRHELAYGIEAVWNTVGSEAFQRDIETAEVSGLDTRYPDGDSDMHFLAAYLTDRWEISPRWVLSAGARFSHVQLEAQFEDKSYFPFLPDEIFQESSALSGNLGMVFHPQKSCRISGLLATGFRAPNVDDLAKVFDSSPGNVIVPNAHVKPEYTYSAELSLNKNFGKTARFETTAFYTFYDDALVVRDYRINGQDSIFYDGVLSKVQATVNAGRARIAGFNANLSAQIGKSWSFEKTFTFIYGQDLSGDVPLDHIPPAFGRFSTKYEARRVQTEAFIQYNGWKRLARYSPSGEDNLAFATPEGMPSWWTLNLRSSFALNSQFSLQFNIENILNHHYRVFASGISSPGRNFIAALRASF